MDKRSVINRTILGNIPKISKLPYFLQQMPAIPGTQVTIPCPGTGSHHIYNYYQPVKGISYNSCWKDPDDEEGQHHIIECPACHWTVSAGIGNNRQLISLYWKDENQVWFDEDGIEQPHSKPFVYDATGAIDHLPI